MEQVHFLPLYTYLLQMSNSAAEYLELLSLIEYPSYVDTHQYVD